MQRNSSDQPYTYRNAGFNGFLNRSLKSNPAASNLQAGIALGSGRPVNFDLQSALGAMGMKLPLGRITLDGEAGRIAITNENGEEVAWFGDLRP